MFHSLSIFVGITPVDFLTRPKLSGDITLYGDSMYDKFRKLLATKLYGSFSPEMLERVQIVSVMATGAGGTDVRYAAHGSPWYQSGKMDGIVTTNLAEVILFLVLTCSKSHCSHIKTTWIEKTSSV